MFDAYELNRQAQYATEDEITYLASVGYKMHQPNTAMLGAGPGVLALALMDKYVQKGEDLPFLYIVDNKSCDYAVKHLDALGVESVSIQYEICDSAEAGIKWKGDDFDLLIVDADHSTEGVLRDIDAWFPKVTAGGRIFFHDYLERDGGFNGTNEWKKGTVAAALEQRQYLPWRVETEVGISIVYRKL